jgi:hypothetical protein
MWRLLARDAGLKDDRLDQLMARLPRTERQNAEKLAIEWRERSAVGAMLQ